MSADLLSIGSAVIATGSILVLSLFIGSINYDRKHR